MTHFSGEQGTVSFSKLQSEPHTAIVITVGFNKTEQSIANRCKFCVFKIKSRKNLDLEVNINFPLQNWKTVLITIFL
jgi:hypothetical protein